MPGPNRAPRGGYQKPKDLGKTISRLLGYLTRSKLPLMAVFGCLLISVFTNIGGSYMMRGIINNFIWSGCTDFSGLALAIAQLFQNSLVIGNTKDLRHIAACRRTVRSGNGPADQLSICIHQKCAAVRIR